MIKLYALFLLKHYYYNDYTTPINSFEREGYINTYFSNLIPNINNFDSDKSQFIYTIDNSNFPNVDINNNELINYAINTCNFIYNNSKIINFNLNLKER